MKKICAAFLMVCLLCSTFALGEVDKTFSFPEISWGMTFDEIYENYYPNLCRDSSRIPYAMYYYPGAEKKIIDDIHVDQLAVQVQRWCARKIDIAGFENCDYTLYFVKIPEGDSLCKDGDAVLYAAEIYVSAWNAKGYESNEEVLWNKLLNKFIAAYGDADETFTDYNGTEFLVWNGQQGTHFLYNTANHFFTYYCEGYFESGAAFLNQQMNENQNTWDNSFNGL